MKKLQLVIITGMSGAGKSTALHALEDIGYYCVDNLPMPLLDELAQTLQQGNCDKAAVVIDVREGSFLKDFAQTIERLERLNCEVEVLFFDAEDEVLLRRFSQTRRKHPLHQHELSRGISEERALLLPVLQNSLLKIDTAPMTVHQLKAILQKRYGVDKQKLTITLVSFGFRRGVPLDANLVFDVRFLANPYFIDSLSPLTGQQASVSDYVLAQPEAQEFLSRAGELLEFYIPQAEHEGRVYVKIAIGCTAGQHRSVAIVNELGKRLQNYYELVIHHRELEK